MVILGGVGNLLGVILGAAIIVALPEIFRDFQVYRLLAFGLLLMVLMIFRPQGLLPVSRPAREDDESARGRPAVSTGRIAPKVPDGASLDS